MNNQRNDCACYTRRQLIRTLGVAAAIAPAVLHPFTALAEKPAEDVPLVNPQSPAEALDLLYSGNSRFVAGKALSPHRNLERLREVAAQQKPFAAFLGCADSRVPIEIVFDQGFGDLFVTRVAGNVATGEEIASLEFGTKVLGAKVLYVLGHTSCGAVTAAMKGEPVPGQISTLFRHIQPAVRAAKNDLQKATEENVRIQMSILAESSPVIAELIKQNLLVVAGGVFDLATGRVTPVNKQDI